MLLGTAIKAGIIGIAIAVICAMKERKRRNFTMCFTKLYSDYRNLFFSVAAVTSKHIGDAVVMSASCVCG